MEDMEEMTYVVLISPDSHLTPSQAVKQILMLKADITVKETCFGIIMQGKKEILDEVIKELRKLDEYGIFIKERGFKIFDNRICRLVRKKRRPGFHQIEREYSSLPYIREGLIAYDKGIISPERIKPKKIKKAELERIIEEIIDASDGVSPN
jgi:putative methanogenesis marker protein 6